MSAISLLRTESNLGLRVDQQIVVADTTIYLRFFDKVTGLAREPNATNRTNLVVTIDKGNKNHEILVLGTVGAASGGVSTCTSVVRFVAYNGVNLTAGTGKQHQAEAEGGCADVANLWNQAYDVFAGTHGTGAAIFRIGKDAAEDISLYFNNDHTTKPKIYLDDSNESQMKGHRGDDEGAAGDFAIGHWRLTTAERDALTSPLNGTSVYNMTTTVMNWREGGAWVANAAGGSIPAADETTLGGVEEATQAEANAGTDAGSEGRLFMVPSKAAQIVQNWAWSHAVDSVGTDAYAAAYTPTVTAYTDGMILEFEAGTANTGAATFDADSVGAKAIKKANDQDLVTGDIEANQKVLLAWDAGNDYWQMLSQTAVALISSANSATLTDGSDAGALHHHAIKFGTESWSVTGASDTDTVAHGLGRVPKLLTIHFGSADNTSNHHELSGVGIGRYDGSSYSCLYYAGSAPNLVQATDTSHIIKFDNAIIEFDVTVTTLDATNFVLDVDSHTTAGVVRYVWRVE